MKAHNIQEDILDSVDQFSGTQAECESFVRIKLDDFNDKIFESMNDDENARAHVECFRNQAATEDYENLALRLQAVGMLDVGWKFWRSSARELRYEELKEEIDILGVKILEKCVASDHFGKFFDSSMEKRQNLYAKGENEYCVRRYLIDKYLIDAFSYNLNINPKNVTMENFNCEDIMKSILEPAYDNLKKVETECSLNILKDNGYYDYLLKLELLSKLPLTSQDKFFERQKFIDVMFDITQKTRECWFRLSRGSEETFMKIHLQNYKFQLRSGNFSDILWSNLCKFFNQGKTFQKNNKIILIKKAFKNLFKMYFGKKI